MSNDSYLPPLPDDRTAHRGARLALVLTILLTLAGLAVLVGQATAQMPDSKRVTALTGE